jgi:general secretion pathway protein B
VSAGVLIPLLYRAVSGSDLPVEDPAQARAPVAGNVTPQSPANLPPVNPGATPGVAAAPSTAPATASTPNTAAPPTPAAAPAASIAAPAASASKASPVRTTATARNASAATATAHTARPAASNPAASQATQPARTPPASEPKLRTLAELPDDLRRSVPALAFGGSVYSDVAAQRMVIFNGQVMREGDPVTDELTLEQIRPRSAVLRLRGQRFEITF